MFSTRSGQHKMMVLNTNLITPTNATVDDDCNDDTTEKSEDEIQGFKTSKLLNLDMANINVNKP